MEVSSRRARLSDLYPSAVPLVKSTTASVALSDGDICVSMQTIASGLCLLESLTDNKWHHKKVLSVWFG